MYNYQKIKIHMILSYEYILYTYIQETYIVTIRSDEFKLMLFKKIGSSWIDVKHMFDIYDTC
jgi:hypothetical protein